MKAAKLRAQIDEYVKGKKWYWYFLLWLGGLYIFVELVRFSPDQQPPFIISVAQAFDFFLHEMAHIVTSFLPPIFTAAAGSLSEILLGALLIYGAIKTRYYFMVLVTSLWFMLACQNAGIYMADARAQKLPLVSLGGDTATHDWNFVFGQLRILDLDTFIGGSVRTVGMIVGILALAFAAWLIWKMAWQNSETVVE